MLKQIVFNAKTVSTTIPTADIPQATLDTLLQYGSRKVNDWCNSEKHRLAEGIAYSNMPAGWKKGKDATKEEIKKFEAFRDVAKKEIDFMPLWETAIKRVKAGWVESTATPRKVKIIRSPIDQEVFDILFKAFKKKGFVDKDATDKANNLPECIATLAIANDLPELDMEIKLYETAEANMARSGEIKV